MPISSRSVARSTLAFLLVGLAALLGIVAMAFWLGERSQVYFEQAIDARDTRIAAVELRNAVQTAESSQRGFIITGNEIYLAPYGTAKAQAQRHLDRLRQLLRTYPNAGTAERRLASIISEKFEEMDETIRLKRARQDDQANALFASNRGKSLMDEANVFFSGVIIQADNRLTDGVNEQSANILWFRTVSGAAALAIIAVVGGAALVLSRYMRELRTARDEVTSMNARLEQRVADRTADLQQARDKAEVLLSEVNHRVANSLAMVASLVGMQTRSVSDPAAKEALAETRDRIFAISQVHKRLYTSNDPRMVTMDEYLSGLLEHLRTSMRNEGRAASLRYDIEPVALSTDASINLGVVATEWVTNAFKYAYPGAPGEIRVHLRNRPDAEVELVVEDDGVGITDGAPAQGTGLGSRIVAAMASNLGAKVDYRPRHPGMEAHLVFPAKRGGATARV